MGWFTVGLIAGRHEMPFSSPSGDGLVHEKIIVGLIASRFSSPSGDGLVRSGVTAYVVKTGFRPRVGMGWF